jgi:hypothetical protein
VRQVTGRVVDARGRPVREAVVLGGPYIACNLGNTLTSRSGATTDRAGRFELDVRTDKALYLLALHGKAGVSRLMALDGGARDQEVTLEVDAPATLSGNVTRDHAPFEAALLLSADSDAGAVFKFVVETTPEGAYSAPVLPPGHYDVLASLPRDSPGTLGGLVPGEIELRAGHQTTHDVAIEPGGFVAVVVDLPVDHDAEMMVYTLLHGEHEIRTQDDLRRLYKAAAKKR